MEIQLNSYLTLNPAYIVTYISQHKQYDNIFIVTAAGVEDTIISIFEIQEIPVLITEFQIDDIITVVDFLDQDQNNFNILAASSQRIYKFCLNISGQLEKSIIELKQNINKPVQISINENTAIISFDSFIAIIDISQVQSIQFINFPTKQISAVINQYNQIYVAYQHTLLQLNGEQEYYRQNIQKVELLKDNLVLITENQIIFKDQNKIINIDSINVNLQQSTIINDNLVISSPNGVGPLYICNITNNKQYCVENNNNIRLGLSSYKDKLVAADGQNIQIFTIK